ncbi:hypothetical protein ACVWWG_007993 [Bradyrhizobium sp. LB7.2]
MTLHEETEKDNRQSDRKSSSKVNDGPGSLLAVVRFREALDRTDMPASFQKIGGFIVRKFNKKAGYAWPTVARIAFECSCSEATVYRAFNEEDGPLREFFRVGKIVIDGEERNTYTPDWAKAATINLEFEIRLKEWQKAQTEKKPAHSSSAQSETSQNERSRPRKMRGDDLSKCETIEVRASNLSDRSYKFRTRSDERVKRSAATSGKGRPSSGPAGNDDLSQFIAELHVILPEHVEFEGDDDRKPFDAERSRRGELPKLRKLIRAGWTKDEVREMVETYVLVARNDESESGSNFTLTYKTLSAIFAELLYKTNDQAISEGDYEFYGRRLPERLLSEPKRHAANDSRRDDRASGDDYLNEGVEVDV